MPWGVTRWWYGNGTNVCIMKILVTGIAGFIGYHLAKALAAGGDEVVGLDNLNDYYDVRLKHARLAELGISPDGEACSALHPGLRFVKMDLADREGVDALLAEERFDVVCHLAAQAGVRYSITHPASYIDSNLVGFFNILESSRRHGVGHFVYASSSSVYGLNKKVPYAETDQVDTPVSLYAATKKSGELMCHAYSKLYGLPTTGIRFFTVYGPWGRPDMAPMKFMRAIIEGQPIQVYNHGNMYRDFTYIDDIIGGVLRIIPSPPKAEIPYIIYNIGNSSPVPLMDFIAAIEETVGRQAVKEFVDMQPGDVYQTYADTSRLQRDFGYKPQTGIRDGISRLYEWFRGFYGV